ncbi:MAG: M81 family metallopeptidase [Gammaproteobacteria bacterium]|nr:M81 family metallopeptidase [Gammaproteobacteria bacterium]MBU1440831.1 M81 family metallopeptidase [Gammaproteobacteria bacterium]MBU2284973.1 M81 family metallopeptidase [Gammaproteobacteria bacterium]MBU2410022.1 M81 family metallopeptidase [Gammaproteobacteria bacterium]
MRFVIAVIRHETNTFSPIETPLGAFSRGTGADGPAYGLAAAEACRNTGCAAAAFIDIVCERGDEFVMPLLANAVPSGTVTAEAFESMAGTILEAVRHGCDAVMLDLHGAMVADGIPDAEGELLRRIRAVAPSVPIAVALDFHANLSAELMSHATVIAGYCTYPHTDMYETGVRAARTLMAKLIGQAEPRILWRALPMITHMLCQTPSRQPMKDIMDRAVRAEAEGEVLNASVFGGFPLADIPHVSLGIVVVADASRLEPARRLVDELAAMAWARRDDFVYAGEPLEQTIAHAKTLRDGPILLVDHGDNCGAGGPTDNMRVLSEVLDQGLEDVIAGPFWDPQAVARIVEAGEGRELTVDVGGRTDTPALGLRGRPLELKGRVRCITDGNYRVTGPMFTGMQLSLGRTAVIDVRGVSVMVCEKPQEPFDAGVFTHAGLDPTAARYVLIKSRQHFRAGFEQGARHILMVSGPGVCSSDYALFPFRHLRRPIHPLDAGATLAHALSFESPAAGPVRSL